MASPTSASAAASWPTPSRCRSTRRRCTKGRRWRACCWPRAERGLGLPGRRLRHGRGGAGRGRAYRRARPRARRRAGAETLGIEPPAELAGLAAIVRELSERCAFEEARVRLTL